MSGGHHPRFEANTTGEMSTTATRNGRPQRVGVWPPSREIARQLGARHFLSPHPCKRGHTWLRITATGNCLSCKREDSRETDLARLRSYEVAGGAPLRAKIESRYRETHREERNEKKRDTRAFDRFISQLQVDE